MHPQVTILAARATSLPNPPSMDASRMTRGQRIAPPIKTMPLFSTKDHANCGMDELARAATFDVLPKAISHASIAYNPAAVRAKQAKAMQTALKYLTTLAVLAVFLVLLAGLWNMTRGTSPNLSQKLMRWRVVLQFLAIVIAMIMVYLLRS